MLRRWAFGSLFTTLLLLGAHASAKSSVGGVGDDEAYRAAQAAWKGCFSTLARAPSFPDRPDPDEHEAAVEVRRSKTGFKISSSYVAGGIEGGYIYLTVDFEARGCRALWVEGDGYDGFLATRVRSGWVNRAAPTAAEIQTLIAEPARIADARHAFARTWLLHKCRGGPSSDLLSDPSWDDRGIAGPIAPGQPWHDGVPVGSPFTYWSTAALDAIGARAALRWFDVDEDDEPPLEDATDSAGVSVTALGRPIPTFATRRFQLFEAKIPGRNGGRAIALFDSAAQRHRWVVVTRGCVQGTTVRWIGAIGDRLVGITHSRNANYAEGDAILIIDAPTATAWAVPFPDDIREAVVESDARRPHASLSGSVLALWVARTKAKLDLAPLLALIPK